MKDAEKYRCSIFVGLNLYTDEDRGGKFEDISKQKKCK